MKETLRLLAGGAGGASGAGSGSAGAESTNRELFHVFEEEKTKEEQAVENVLRFAIAEGLSTEKVEENLTEIRVPAYSEETALAVACSAKNVTRFKSDIFIFQ